MTDLMAAESMGGGMPRSSSNENGTAPFRIASLHRLLGAVCLGLLAASMHGCATEEHAAPKQVPVFVFTNRVRNLGVKGGLAGLKGRAGAAVKRSSSGMLRMAVQLEQEDKDAISKNAESWWRAVTKAVLEIGLFYGGGAILNDGETAVLVVYQA